MSNYIFELLRGYLTHYGYWAVGVALLLENAGLPVPGETILLLASFLAYSEHKLGLPWIILVGVCAATLGDNLGFAIGYYGGRPLLERYQKTLRIRPKVIARGEELFARYGAITIFVARFIAGMRIIAGPLAGVLRMPLAQIPAVQFSGRDALGQRDRDCRIPLWQALGSAGRSGAGCKPRDRSGSGHPLRSFLVEAAKTLISPSFL